MSKARFLTTIGLTGLASMAFGAPGASAGVVDGHAQAAGGHERANQAVAVAARSCTAAIPDIYELRARQVGCRTARKVSLASFNKITQCLKNDRCSVGRFRCDPNPAQNAPAGLAGGRMVCKKGRKQKVTYGYGG